MKRIPLALTVLMFTSAAMVQMAFSQSDDSSKPTDRERIIRGFAIAPVPLDLHNKNHDLVGLGSYLVNAVGGCNDCHTNPSYTPDGDPFRGLPKRSTPRTTWEEDKPSARSFQEI